MDTISDNDSAGEPIKQPTPMNALPLDVGFAVEYLDGYLESEPVEVRQQWALVRAYLLQHFL
jgi:hypothetical protein